MKPTWQQRNERNFAAAAPQELDAYMQQKYGLPFDSVDAICRISAKLARGEITRIEGADARMLKSIYANVDPKLVDRSIADVNSMHSPTQRVQALSHHLVGDPSPDSPMVKEVYKLLTDYGRSEIESGILERRAAAARDPEGRPTAERAQERKVDPLSTRTLLERQVLGPTREATAALQAAPEVAAELLANKMELASSRLEANSAGAMPMDTRSTLEAAYDFHASEEVARDEGLLPPDSTP
jgi:hypothetical protein